MDAQRYHLTLSSGDRPAMHGWWGVQATAERKLAMWVEEFRDVEGARVVLTDEVEGDVLAVWPGGEA